MAELMPKNHDEVLITLTDKSKDAPKFLSRRLTLSAETNTRQVGRSSSRYNTGLSASPTNAWFDNAVMSREHAEIIWDPATQLVSIRDTGSLHGTSLNGFQLPPWTKKRVQVGDILKFGAPVEKELKAFHPSEVQISSIDLGPPQLPLSKPRTNTFTVPDESEVEEIGDDVQAEELDSDSDDGGVARSAKLVQQTDFHPLETPEKKGYPTTIDLTEEVNEEIPVREPEPFIPEPTPPTVRVERTSTTTFAPALRFQKQPLTSDELLGLGEETSSEAMANFQSEPEMSLSPDSPLADIIDDSCEFNEASTFSDPSGATTCHPPPQPKQSIVQSSENVTDLMSFAESYRSLHGPVPRSLSYIEQLTALEQAKASVSGTKRKFADFEGPDPKTCLKHMDVKLSEQTEGVNLAQLASCATSGHKVSSSRNELATTQQPTTAPRRDIPGATNQPERPRKRIRRVAEAMGYAALGGIAVMSALIATAPDL